MDLRPTEHTRKVIKEAQEWLRRAHVNARAAKLLVEQGDPKLLVEAITQVQQACEKATKAVLLEHGMPYDEVKDMGHNTIGAFVSLMARMLDRGPLAKKFSHALLKEDATEAATTLTKVVLSGKRNKETRKDVAYAFKIVLPQSSRDLGNNSLSVEKWRRLTRAFPPKVVEVFIDFHVHFSEMWQQYINEIHNVHVDPWPLLAEEVTAETWVFSPAYAGLPRRFPGQESDAPINPILMNLVQQLLNERIAELHLHRGEEHWHETVNVRGLLLHVSNWLTSLSWLFLCATVTTPHAVSSRYPAEESPSTTVKGSQHYNEQLGVVVCIYPLAVHTEGAIQNLRMHYSQVEQDYTDMLR